MNIKIPELALVTLIGVSGSGKSTFAKKHFKPTEIISSDYCRALVSDNENDQTATEDAFKLLHYLAAIRLKRGLLTVIDATNVQEESRKSLVKLAREYHVLPVAIVIDIPEKICEQRNKVREDRDFGSHVIRMQRQQLRRSIKRLRDEGFRHIFVLDSPEQVDSIEGIIRDPLYNNKKAETGPFDIIGDIHGCYDELTELLEKLNYRIESVPQDRNNYGLSVTHPENRKALFLGDLVDRGPKTPEVLKLVMSMVNSKTAYCVPGNHDMKLHKKLSGKNVNMKHGLEQSMEQLSKESSQFIENTKIFLEGLVSHYVFDGGNLVVAHAGLREEMHGRGSGAVRNFCMFGETTGETDEFGLPVRYNWAMEYRGKAMVVYGHTPVPEAQWLNRTINIDTGCVFGGKLTALRYPERELVSVDARQVYSEPVRPLDYKKEDTSTLTFQQEHDDILDIDDVIGKHIVNTKYGHNITIREENSIAALEVMSRFAVNPKWLIYLPPTMSPSETSTLPDILEHPAEAIGYYKSQKVDKVICEEKHMGSRTIVVICQDEEAARKRFGVVGEGIGICYTRSGRNFFNNPELEKQFLQRVNEGLTKSGFWEKHQTDWVILDCELMPWSAKAQTLLQGQYAAVGASAKNAIPDAVKVLKQAAARGIDIGGLEQKYDQKHEMVEQYIKSYGKYCWPVHSVNDYKLAPFHILATEGAVHIDKSHEWHMEEIKLICSSDEQIFKLTPYKIIEVNDEAQVNQAIEWWEDLTLKGGEGMVVKPYYFLQKGKTGIVQPAIKCRGKEYLRIIYGPEYTAPENLARLKNRGVSSKRSLAYREFSLGLEGLERFVNGEPLRKVHECVFGVLALESEMVDPRL
jgi:protein phosphatase